MVCQTFKTQFSSLIDGFLSSVMFSVKMGYGRKGIRCKKVQYHYYCGILGSPVVSVELAFEIRVY